MPDGRYRGRLRPPPIAQRRPERISNMRLQRQTGLAVGVAMLVVIASFAAVLPRSQAQTGEARSPGAEHVADTRERVRVTPAERDAILLEMRTMLQSLSGIMHGLIASDLDMARKAAGASGMAAALDPGLEKNLPAGYRHLNERTHKRFDALAEAIKTGGARDGLLKRLAAVTASCVSCHDTYRLDEAKQ